MKFPKSGPLTCVFVMIFSTVRQVYTFASVAEVRNVNFVEGASSGGKIYKHQEGCICVNVNFSNLSRGRTVGDKSVDVNCWVSHLFLL
jgi:hypothetical protein